MYWFDGRTYVHRGPATVEQASKVGQIIFEGNKETPPKSPPTEQGGKSRSMCLYERLHPASDAEATAKILSVLLEEYDNPVQQAGQATRRLRRRGGRDDGKVNIRTTTEVVSPGWERFLGFPVDDALEVIDDFFTWNKKFGGLMVSSLMMSLKV